MASSNSTDSASGGHVYAGRFEYQKPLGKGAGGSVYLAEDLHNEHRRVGLKVLSADQCEGVEGKMLRREFEILSKLDHPHLVRVYDYGTLADGGVYLAEEYIDGASLQDVRALLGPDALIDVVRQVLLGLSYLHGMGMIHRDVKPANVMLLWLDDGSARPMVKLVDFGLSSMNPRRDSLRGGTRSYMAPEIIDGNEGELRSDLFSLGVTLYYALCGTLPFGPRSEDDPPPTEEDIDPPSPHQYDPEIPLSLSRFTMVLLRQVDGVEYRDAGEALHALVRDTESGQVWSETVASNAFDIAAVPVLRGFFDRGILQRRKGQHKHLAEALNEDEGGGRMHLLRGEEGVGKSRLLSEVKATTKLDGKLVLSVRCEKGMRAWELVHELFARLVELGEARDVEELDYYTPYLLVLERFSSLEGETTSQVTEAVDFDWIRRAFHDAIGALKPREVVMFIEDLHEGDIASRQFLADWFEGESRLDVPDMVVSTRDQRAVSTPFLAADRVELYDLDGLQRVDVRHFFRDRLELEDVPDDWLDRLADAADGRPAYLQEICRTLIEEGVLRRKTGRSWELDVEVLQDFALPDDVRGILRRRIDSAGASAREVLEFLVLAGRPVPWEWVRDHAASQDESLTEADRRLDALWRQDLVRMTLEVGGRYLQPANEELEDVVGDLMNPSWRRRIHRKLGEHLVGEWRRGDLDAAVAADQFEAGGREDEAARLYEAAGDRCWRRAEFGGAHDRYRAALEGTEETAAGAFLRLKLARVYLTLYEGWAMERALKKAGALAERTALDWVMYTTFLSAVGSSQAMGDDGAASEWLDRLADCLPTMSRQAAVLDRRSRLAWRSGDLEEARQLGERALRRARHFGERSQLTSILSSLGQLAHWSGDQRKSEERFQKALEVGGSGERTDRAAALYRYGTCLRRRGDERRAADRLQEALEILSRGHRPDLWIRALMEVSKCHAAAGSLDASRRYSSDALVFARELGDDVLLNRVRFARAEIELTTEGSTEFSIRDMDRAVRGVEAADTAIPHFVDMLERYGRCVQSLETGEGDEMRERARRRADELGIELFPGRSVERTG